jgi:hypothetical protein
MSTADGFVGSRPRPAGQPPAVIPGYFRQGWPLLAILLCAAVGVLVGIFASRASYRATVLVKIGAPLSGVFLVPPPGAVGPIGPGPPGRSYQELARRDWEWLARSPELPFLVRRMHHGFGALKLRSGFQVSRRELPKLIDATQTGTGKRLHHLAAGATGLALSQVAPSRRKAIDLANLYTRALGEAYARYAGAELDARYADLADRPYLREGVARTKRVLREGPWAQLASSAQVVRPDARSNGILGGIFGAMASVLIIGSLYHWRAAEAPAPTR